MQLQPLHRNYVVLIVELQSVQLQFCKAADASTDVELNGPTWRYLELPGATWSYLVLPLVTSKSGGAR